MRLLTGGKMKRLFFGIAAITASVGPPALAADMPVKAPPLAATPFYSWTGCYIGANLGGGWDNISTVRTAAAGGVTFPPEYYGGDSGSAFVGGGQIGCDYQVNKWVFGIQAQGDWGNINSSHVIPLFPTFDYNTSVRGFDTFTGRVGYTVLPQTLLYAKGGGAYVKDSLTVTIPSTNFLSEYVNPNFTGWTAGVGAEWLFMPNVSLFVEYDYLGFVANSVTFIAGPGAVGAGLPADVINHTQNISTVLGGLNYRFNLGSAPCCAIATKD
jgi:outer membrane immunogenic protein